MDFSFSDNIMKLRYSWEQKETWEDIAKRVVENVFKAVDFPNSIEIQKELIEIVSQRKFIPGGRFLAQSGRPYHQVNNCFLLRAEDTREGWGDLLNKSTVMLMSGGGIGIDYSQLRPEGTHLKRSGGTSSGSLPLMRTINEVGRGVMSGGKRRSAIWAGLRWDSPDIEQFIVMKDWIPELKKIKEKNFDFPAPMDMTNISVLLDKLFFDAYGNKDNPLHQKAKSVYWQAVEHMVTTGEPGFSIDYNNPRESLRNACTEIVSEDDSDVCCLGSINLANIENINELKKVTDLGQLFLIMGTLYSDVPTNKVALVKNQNRRTGLGLMGIHEWLIIHGHKYEENEELEKWLSAWKRTSDSSAKSWASILSVNEPIKKRAIAPNGTISIAGGRTTSGIEPIFSLAYQRRYLTPDGWKKQYVVDFVAEKVREAGDIDISTIQDAYQLALNSEKRILFQAFVQRYVDNAISSTVNLPSFGNLGNNDFRKFGNMLMKHLPELRGITCYPDGSRGGQPLVQIDPAYALSKRGLIFEGNEECSNGICGL